jgi:hypothetical protein
LSVLTITNSKSSPGASQPKEYFFRLKYCGIT